MTWDEDIERAVEVIFNAYFSRNAIDAHFERSDEEWIEGTHWHPGLDEVLPRNKWYPIGTNNPPSCKWFYKSNHLMYEVDMMLGELEDNRTLRDMIRFFVQSRGIGLLYEKFDTFTANEVREDILRGVYDYDRRDFQRRFNRIWEDEVTLGDERLGPEEMIRMANPNNWRSGQRSAIRFCHLAGFPLVFAGTNDTEKLEHYEKIEFRRMPNLADFQEDVGALITETLEAEEDYEKRGLVILPTGSGKTRVTSESLIKWYLDSEKPRIILWICHRKELCYQASETFERVWQKIAFDDYANPWGRDLNIHRFWGDVNWSDNGGSSENSALSRRIDREGGALVICTIDTLREIANNNDESHTEAREGIMGPDCVVIDEAHRFETPRYRETLAGVGVGLNLTSQDQFGGRLIGLTATPYRSDERQMSYMYRRYGGRFLLDDLIGTESPTANQVRTSIASLRSRLEEKGVLAKAVVQMVSFGDQRRDVGSEALDEFSDLKESWMKTNLGNNSNRNQAMVEKIVELNQEGRKSILFFGLSVEHSKLVTMSLNSIGIRSEVVHSKTRRVTRRSFVERFRRGEIEVLSNYGIFDTGFDAPNVDAIVIARPIGSEVLLQQIVGRGLRGREFGGTDDCVIVAVQDMIFVQRADNEGNIRTENYGLQEDEIKGVLGEEE